MNILNLILPYYTDNELESLRKDLQVLDKKIEVIDSYIKFTIQNYFTVLAIMIALVSLVSIFGVKVWINKRIDEYVTQRLEEIIKRSPKYDVISGNKIFSNYDFKDGKYSFVIGGNDLNIECNKNNFISIRPLYGEEELKYKAKVINGNLIIKFENFNIDINKGISWKIIYYK